LSSHLLYRFALVAVALVAVAWLGLSLRATRLEADGQELVQAGQRQPLGPAEVSEGLDILRRAQRFNEDSAPRLAEAALLAGAGRHDEAIAAAERVVEDEPDNLEGWVVLYLGGAATENRSLATRALRAISRLNPQLAERIRSQAAQGS
jgi:cytochrome c-type biogenesis protein CcmH/NrfG